MTRDVIFSARIGALRIDVIPLTFGRARLTLSDDWDERTYRDGW